MSYIQIEIGGKLRGLKFNQGALIISQMKIDQDNIAASAAYAMFYAGLKSNAYVKGVEFVDEIEEDGKKKEVPITFEMVCDWVDDLKEEDTLAVLNCFKETQAYKKIVSEVSDEDKKKLEVITEPIASESVVDG